RRTWLLPAISLAADATTGGPRNRGMTTGINSMLPSGKRLAAGAIHRPSFFGLLALMLLVGLASAAEAQPRNVVFILSDDHRYDFMGFHPDAPEWLETPSLDRMANEGVHLANAFVTTSLCSPSRASILTGRYAHRHGVVDNTSAIPEGTRFFPEYLQQGGYNTG